MAKTVYEQLLEQISNITENVRNKAMKVYQSVGQKLRSSNDSGNQFMQRDKERLYSRLQPQQIGRLTAFFYDPKLKKDL
jgi:gas vesicle protein